jgi:hypothetical protein
MREREDGQEGDKGLESRVRAAALSGKAAAKGRAKWDAEGQAKSSFLVL